MRAVEMLQKIAKWAEESNYNPACEATPEGVLSLLNQLRSTFAEQPDLVYEALAVKLEEGFSEAVQIANLMQFLASDDPDIQEQGYQLLLSLESEAAWESIMTGATVACPLKHKSYRMTAKFKTVLLSNPFWDYSDLTRYRITGPFAQDCQHLHHLKGLSHLTIVTPSSLTTLDGIEQIPNLRTLEFQLGYDSADHLAQLFGNTTTSIENITTIVLNNLKRESYGAIDLSLFLKVTSLERVIVHDSRVSYDALPPVIPFALELHLHTRRGFSGFLPEKDRTITISKLRLIKEDATVCLFQFMPHRIEEIEVTDTITVNNLTGLLQAPPYPRGDLTQIRHQYQKFVALNKLRSNNQKFFQALADYLKKPQQELTMPFSRSSIEYPKGLRSKPVTKVTLLLRYKSYWGTGLPNMPWFPQSCVELEVHSTPRSTYSGNVTSVSLPKHSVNITLLRLKNGVARTVKSLGAQARSRLQTIVLEFDSATDLHASHLYRLHKSEKSSIAIHTQNLPDLTSIVVYVPTISPESQTQFRETLLAHMDSSAVEILFPTETDSTTTNP